MNQLLRSAVLTAMVLSLSISSGRAQEVKSKNAKTWQLSGRVQLQYLLNTDIDSDDAETNNGFRIRRGRLQATGQLTDWVQTKFQVEIRDNSPRLKDAEGKILLGERVFVRFGQFKVPVWREELRSSSKLLLIERSAAADFLVDNRLSARHIGVEVSGKAGNRIQWAVNLSNGAGEGGREDAGRTKDGAFVNNGKMVTGRVNVPVSKRLEVGVSGAANRGGADTGTTDNTGTLYTIAPDFGLYLSTGAQGQLDIEGGLAVGSMSSEFTGTAEDVNFVLFDVTGRWMTKLTEVKQNLGGLDAFELAAGISFIEPNTDFDDDEALFFRFGPAVYFGKQTRLQVNAELEQPTAEGADTVLQFRAQTTFNF
ncbi:hypothetical protein GWO43_02780 [candidate division KSB1 bacterium]|nr:hypothetical protein [candidate division KSB1 bacterium]NIR69858.1 hypothetical protein [candidate division KSB1 bacterium]NIS22977.1 hypothetical protein [candidate division KSB1 bacterium]NIT69835.1 hypothetical protein [candidate division KSB1 bacterium]NIU25757.1 hypothetical protein [candidate division KSB1 bacterium]